MRVPFTPQDEEGQTVLHFAASHSHSEGCFYALIRQGHVLLAERDGRYRTARDVAREASQRDNLLDLDQYVLDAFLERRSDLLRALAHQGYDQLLNAVDKHGRDVTSIVTQFEMTDMQSLMHELAYFFVSDAFEAGRNDTRGRGHNWETNKRNKQRALFISLICLPAVSLYFCTVASYYYSLSC